MIKGMDNLLPLIAEICLGVILILLTIMAVVAFVRALWELR